MSSRIPWQRPARATWAASRALLTAASWSSNQSISAGVTLNRRKLWRNLVDLIDREVVDGRLELGLGETPAAPAEPGEVLRRRRPRRGRDVKDTAIKRRSLELFSLLSQKSRYRARPSQTRSASLPAGQCALRPAVVPGRGSRGDSALVQLGQIGRHQVDLAANRL